MKYLGKYIQSFVLLALPLGGVAGGLISCSDDKFEGDPIKDLSGTTEFVLSTEEAGYSTYYTPAIGTVGDPMPFYDKKAGDFKVMYLQEYTDNLPLRYHPYWAVSTADGASYESLGEWLSIGKYDSQQDAVLGTGCCYYNEADGLYYIYYTGESGKTVERQVVMRATSPDLKTWTRDNAWSLNGPKNNLSGFDFRDPQIFMVGNEYHMLVAGRNAVGNDAMFAEFKSSNMKDWTYVDKFHMLWDRMYECPDVFQMGDWWYLVYSDSPSWERTVKYVKAKSYEELKTQFTNDGDFDARQYWMKLDTRAFYAGKTASNGTDRFIWGWCPTRPDGNNANVGNPEPKWSGALVCHKIAQNADGSLYLTAVPAMAAKYNKPVEVKEMEKGDNYTLYNRLGAHNHISFTVKTAGKDDKFGVSFGRGKGNDKFVTLRFNNPHWDWDKGEHKFRTEYWIGNGVEDEFINNTEGNFFPFAEDNTYNVDIYTDNSVVVVYVNGTGCMTNRIYGLANNCWSINRYGNVTVSDLKVSQY